MLPVLAIVSEISKHRPYSVQSFYRHAKALGIKHAGYPTRPKLYRVEDGNRILRYLGVEKAEIQIVMTLSPSARGSGRLATMPALRRIKRNGRKQ